MRARAGLTPEEVKTLLKSNLPVTQEHVARIATNTGIALSRLKHYIGIPFIEFYNQQICGVVTAKVGEREIAATASFVSALPGVFLAGEIIKERISSLRKFTLNNYLKLSVFNPSSRWLLNRPKDERCRCLCDHPIMQETYKKKWI